MNAKAFLRVDFEAERFDAVFAAMAREPISDRPAFREIVERLGAKVEAHFFSAKPNSVDTQERKRRGPIRRDASHGGSGSNPAAMFSSGNSFAHLEQRSTDVSAAVKASTKEDFWLSLHNAGKGWAYWTIDNRTGYRKTSRKDRKQKTSTQHAADAKRMGTVTFPERPLFYIEPSDEAWALERVSQAVEDSLMRRWDDPSAD